MMKLKSIFLMAGVLLACAAGLPSCGGDDNNPSNTPTTPSTPDTPDTPDSTDDSFVKGADISWSSWMKDAGLKLYNAAGEERECTALMKELGMDAIRLRVFVNPDATGGYCAGEGTPGKGYCGKDDVVAKATVAKELGMDVMIDFHYSDTWADPDDQHVPAAWKNMKTAAELKAAIADHTKDVLEALKTAGVTPKWVQVGNEIRPGMLVSSDYAVSGASWSGELKGNAGTVNMVKNWSNLAGYINAACDAVKAVFTDAKVIVHLDNGWDKDTYTWFFDELKKNNGKWDMIGMSLYPYWTNLYNTDYAESKIISDCIANIKTLSSRYDCDVMIVETGMQCADADTGALVANSILAKGKQQLTTILEQCKNNTNGRCRGVFYWEPECRPGKYRLGAFDESGRPTVIMEAFN